MVDHTGTGEGLIAFLTYTADKGLMNAGTAKAYRAAVREILSTVEEDWPSVDVATLDVDDVLKRFEVKSGMNYTPGSLKTYKSRFRNGLVLYSEYLQDPSGWRPPKKPPSRSSSGSSPHRVYLTSTSEDRVSTPYPMNVLNQVDSSEVVFGIDASKRASPDMQTYPFPLRRDSKVVFVTLTLPADLTMKEVERISAHLKTLAVPEPLAIPARPQPDANQGDN